MNNSDIIADVLRSRADRVNKGTLDAKIAEINKLLIDAADAGNYTFSYECKENSYVVSTIAARLKERGFVVSVSKDFIEICWA